MIFGAGKADGARARPEEAVEDRQRRMLREIESDALELSDTLGKPSLDPRVMTAMGKVPRHRFVPPEHESVAYVNHALSIGHGQTISQPFIVALMTDLLGVGEGDRVLEVGTGSGYQAAVLAEMGVRVHGIEVIAELAGQARERLARLGYDNVEVCTGDGHRGWPEHAPYDGIIVTAAAERVPPALVEQLRVGRRMVIPLGLPYETQWLTVVERDEEGEPRSRSILPVAFVPMRGED